MLIDPVRLELEVARAAVESGRSVRSRFRVRGWSMLPALAPGMRVTVESAAPESLRPGELVCWCRPVSHDADGLQKVVHRLICFERDAAGGRVLVTRGDANGWDDPPVPADRVIGRVLGVEKAPLRFRLRRLAARMKAGLLGASFPRPRRAALSPNRRRERPGAARGRGKGRRKCAR